MLALRALGLGDLITAVPALRGLRRSFPSHRVVLATSPNLAPLVEEMDFVDAMLGTGELEELPVQLDGDDVAVNLHGRGPESTVLLLDTSPSRLIAFAHPDIPATFGFPIWRRHEHEVTRWCRLLTENGVETHSGDLTLPFPRRRIREASGATVLHPGASSPARQWPPDRWAAVAASLAAAGDQVVITGDGSEVALSHEIAREAGLSPGSVLAGRTDVADLASAIAAAGRVISCDTGPAHLATAFGTPSLTLFGPTSPEQWGPPKGDLHQVIWNGRSGPPNGDVPAAGLLEIGVDDVLDAVDRLPRRSVRFRRPPEPRPEDRTPVGSFAPGGRRPPAAQPKDGW